jgi:hypothetical protein
MEQVIQTITCSRVTLPVSDIVFRQDGKEFKYAPLEDITNVELSYIVWLMACGVGASMKGSPFDWKTFILKHNLIRHFTGKIYER